MHASDRHEAADRADFEQVLCRALDTPEIRESLRRPGVRTDVERLRSQALAATETISAAAAAEYTVYLRLRDTTGHSTAHLPDRPRQPQQPQQPQQVDVSKDGRGLLAALAVLAPVLSVMAAAIFLLIGYALRLADSQQPLADALVGTGWLTAGLAALTALIAAAALVVTAVRHRSAPGGHPHQPAPAVIEARAAWQQALLERGMLPFLHQRLHLSAPAPVPDADAQPTPPRPTARDPLPKRRTQLGYTSPDFASPDFTGPAAPRGTDAS
ncbi:hypothetical protein [Streptomyces sp. 35G-GA-8]|uniref:hypothetical protein n=1 Tax=Streptomyces sp. 35G-GA-8 TaxID=2939434 RepID=UPI00201EDA1B|nr:hypothetical protein [Streptomyces sp. 35G-GA-8]MCL7375311.1 hypothetical protein [Streptomyces sp. 35G-GA-8]